MNMDDEVRNEYLVNAKQKRIWAVEMDLLTKLLEICDKYNLTVWALAGTMLGAVRHKGFIPWDDDIDVGMPRKDFEKLKEVAEVEFKEPYFLQTPKSDPYYFAAGIRLRNSNTTAIIVDHKLSKENGGIYMDIFPLDAWPGDKNQQKELIKDINFYKKMLYYRHYLKNDSIKHTFYNFVQKVYFLINRYDKVLDKYDAMCRKYEESDTEMLAYVARGTIKHDGFRYEWTKEETKETIWLDFEDMKIPVPCGYKSCLEKRYGDYMKFPPVEKRGKWHEEKIIFDPDTPYKDFIRRGGVHFNE